MTTMKALVTGGAGSSARRSSTACSPRTGASTSSTTSRPARSRNLADARARCPIAGSRSTASTSRRRRSSTSSRTASPMSIFHLAAQIDVRVSVARPGVRRDRQHPRFAERARGRARGRREKVVFAAPAARSTAPRRDPDARDARRSVPESPYGVAKKAVGDYLHYYREQRGLEYTALALANVYGPRQDPHGEAGVVAIFAGKLLDRERPSIFGDGSQTRDFVYVDDVVDAFVRAVDKGGGLMSTSAPASRRACSELYDVDGAASPASSEPPRYAPRASGRARTQRARPGRAPRSTSAGSRSPRSKTVSAAPSSTSSAQRGAALR